MYIFEYLQIFVYIVNVVCKCELCVIAKLFQVWIIKEEIGINIKKVRHYF